MGGFLLNKWVSGWMDELVGGYACGLEEYLG